MLKKISCCLILADYDNIFLCRPTGSDFWEPPKGLYDWEEDIDFTHAAVRECREETNLEFVDYIADGEVTFIGVYPYNKKKDLAVSFIDFTDVEALVGEDLECTSTFMDSHGNIVPEIQDWVVVSWADAIENRCLPHMSRILADVYEKMYEKDVDFNVPDAPGPEDRG